MENIKLTPSELELIQLKREEEINIAKQKQIQKQLEYEKSVLDHKKRVKSKKEEIERKNDYMIQASNVMIKHGAKEYITLIEENTFIQDPFGTNGLNPKDITKESCKYVYIKTKWGDIRDFNSELKTSNHPNLGFKQLRTYSAFSIAKKLLEKDQEEKLKNHNEIKREEYLQEIMEYFKSIFPEGTIYTPEVKYEFYKYKWQTVNTGKTGEKYYYITINIPNGSWVEIIYFIGNWRIINKFDSKYIQPESDKDWLEYLAKP